MFMETIIILCNFLVFPELFKDHLCLKVIRSVGPGFCEFSVFSVPY